MPMVFDPSEPIKPGDSPYVKAIKRGYRKEHEGDGTLATAIIIAMLIMFFYVTCKQLGID